MAAGRAHENDAANVAASPANSENARISRWHPRRAQPQRRGRHTVAPQMQRAGTSAASQTQGKEGVRPVHGAAARGPRRRRPAAAAAAGPMSAPQRFIRMPRPTARQRRITTSGGWACSRADRIEIGGQHVGGRTRRSCRRWWEVSAGWVRRAERVGLGRVIASVRSTTAMRIAWFGTTRRGRRFPFARRSLHVALPTMARALLSWGVVRH